MRVARTAFWVVAVITVAIAVLTGPGCSGAVSPPAPIPDAAVAAGVARAAPVPTAAPGTARGDEKTPALPPHRPLPGNLGLAASPWRAGQVALWDHQRVTIGQLDGAWHRWAVPEGYRPVAAAFDPAGRLHLLDDDGLLLTFAAGQPPRQRRLSFARQATRRLGATRRALVWIGKVGASFTPPPARVSRDGGESWVRLQVPEAGNAGVELRLDPDGGLQLMTGSEAACGGGGQHRELGRLTTKDTATWRPADWPLDAPYGWFTGPRGWAYAVVRGEDGCRPSPLVAAWICAVPGSGRPRPLQLPAGQRATLDRVLADGVGEGLEAANGRALLLLVGGHGEAERVLLVSGASGRLLGPAPEGLTALALDAADRPLALAKGRLQTWSGAGWRPQPLPSD